MALEANDEADADKEPAEDVGDELNINPEEVQMLKQIINPPPPASHPPHPSRATSGARPTLTTVPARRTHLVKIWMPAEAPEPRRRLQRLPRRHTQISGPEDDIDIVRQIRYKTDLQHSRPIVPTKLILLTSP